MKQLILIVISIFACYGTVSAQPNVEEKIKAAGKDFWLSVFSRTRKNEVYITGKHNATVTFNYTDNNTTQTFNLQAGEILKVPLEIAQMNLILNTNIEVVQNKSLHITSDSNIVVQFVEWGGTTDDGCIIYPSDRQKFGDTYFLNGAVFLSAGYFGNSAGGFTLVSSCDSVTLEITPTRNTALHPATIPFTINLNKGQTYTIANRGTNAMKDLSGTKIKIMSASCCNPLNVFYTAMSQYMYWPYSATGSGLCCGDYMMEQILPTAVWDTIHHVVPSVNNPYNILKLVSATDANSISFDGVIVATLNEGGTLDTIINAPTIVTSSNPISIMQFMMGIGTLFGGNPIPDNISPDSMTDPNAAWVLPLRDGLREAYFKTVGQGYENFGYTQYNGLHVLTLISKAGNISSITLNNTSIANQFQPFPGNPEYMYANIRPDTGIDYHLLSSERIIAYYYAATGTAGSINFQLGDVTPPVFYTELPNDTIVGCKNTTHLLDGGDAFLHEWSTNEFTRQIEAGDSGLYYVLRHYDDDCIGELKRFIITNPATYLPPLYLGEDTMVCKGDRITLTGLGPSTEWSTGFTGDQIVVNTPGIYWATVRDTCINTFVTDTIIVNDTICLDRYCKINFPNAFSPNNDGLNDVFRPYYYGNLNGYALSIYNRWGERLFTSYKIDSGWDGEFNGALVDVGVYFYQCNFYCPLLGYINLKGDVTLIR